jgi:hypothetical protein
LVLVINSLLEWMLPLRLAPQSGGNSLKVGQHTAAQRLQPPKLGGRKDFGQLQRFELVQGATNLA